MSSKSRASKHGSMSISTISSNGSVKPIEHKDCVYRYCRSCKVCHCRCVPCGRYERAEAAQAKDFTHNGVARCTRDCTPLCSRCCVNRANVHTFNRVSYHEVTHRVREEDIHIDRDDINERSRRHGRVFNMCRAYVGDEDERVAVKWVHEGHKCDKDHYWEAIKNAKESAKIVRAFLNETDTHGWKLKVLIPQKAKGWFQRNGHRSTVIVEPYLSQYDVFYKKSDDIHLWHGHRCYMVMEALIHFSIRYSKRESMISNLKGFVDRDEKIIYLSGPSVLDHKAFEERNGIITAFLREHNCSQMCRRHH